MKQKKFFAVVILYNTNILDSVTCENLKKISKHDISVIIADNSTISIANDIECEKIGWQYISMNGNVGLSKAYNEVLNNIKEKDGFVIWFDDDTNITQEYFDELDKLIELNPKIDIFAPIIYGQDNKIYSPNEARFFKNKQLKNPNKSINLKKFNAINSCTAVNLKIYDEYRYDERIFLDQVDHKFFEDQRDKKRNFYKMNTIIHHNFSLKSKKNTPQECWKRYEIMIPDYLTFCSKTKMRTGLGIIKVMGWGVRESINYKNPIFLFWCLKKSIKSIYNIKGRNF